jgi:hypothetical protein
MDSPSLKKAGLLMLVIVIGTIAAREIFLRKEGADISYDDGPALWAHARSRVYEPASKAIVFIGSSRIKYDLDIPTWQAATHTDAIQLACVGSTPLPVLIDLANDPQFKGHLVVDVTEILFFSPNPSFGDRPNNGLKYYKDLTLAQRAGLQLDKAIESQLVFLDKDNYSLNAELDKLEIPNRPGYFAMPLFPMEFERTKFDRQSYMTEKMVQDTNIQNRVKGIWDFLGNAMRGAPPTPPEAIDGIFATVKASVDKIQARGGKVIFTRTPSGGPYLFGEKMGFPREKYWDKLLAVTGCPGIYFSDYPALAQQVCPENSHLTPAGAVVYTKTIVDILTKEKGWTFTDTKND